MRRLLSRFIDLRPGEGALAAKAFFTLFFMIAAHTILETARDALFLSKLPPSQLNVVYIVVAVLTFVFAGASTAFAIRFGRRNALLCSLVFAAYVTALLHFFDPTPRIAIVLYVFSGLVGAILVPQFWLLSAQMFTVSQGRRLFGSIASSGVLGAVMGATLAAGVLSIASVTVLLLVSAGLFLLTAIISTAISVEDAPPPPSSSSSSKDETKSSERLGVVFRDNPFLRRIGALVILSTAAVLVVDYFFKSTAANRIPHESLGLFFARFYAVMNAVSLVVQLLLSSRLLGRLGVLGAVALMPFLLTLGGVGAVAFGGSMTVALVGKTFDGGLRHSLNRTGTELLYLPLPASARERGKSFIDGFVSRLAQATVAALLLGLATLGLATPRILGAMILVLSFAWLLTAVLSRGRYLDLFRAALASGHLGASPIDAELDLASAEVLVEGLSSPEATQVVAAMNLLAQKKHGKLIPALILYHASETVLVRALEIFGESDRKDWIPLGERALAHANVEVRIAALRALAKHDVVKAVERATEDVSSRVQAYAALYISMRGEEADLVDHPLIAVLLKMPGEFGIASRVGLLAAVADAPTPRAAGVLLALAKDGPVLASPNATAQMARAMGELGDPQFVPALVERLSSRAGREAVRSALVKIGDPAFEALAKALCSPTTPTNVRLHVPRTIGYFRNQRACDLLTEQLASEKDGRVRYKVLRGLGLLVGTGVKMKQSVIEDEARRNLRDHLRTLARRVAVAGDRQRASRVVVGDEALDLLTGLLDDKLDQSLERALRLLKLVHPREDMHRVHTVARTGDRHARANAIEFLDALLVGAARRELRDLLRIVLDDIGDRERVDRAGAAIGEDVPRTENDAIASMLEDHDEALAVLAVQHALTVDAPPVLLAAVERARKERPSLAALGDRWFGGVGAVQGA